MAKKVGVILSGSGVYDGSEIHEAVLTLLALDRRGVDVLVCAPDVDQMHVVNHLTGQAAVGERRNVLVESARIARGAIRDVAGVAAKDLDALMLPGGFGAAKNLCDFAVRGPACEVHPEVARLIREVHDAGKPVAAICIAPAVLAKVLGETHPELTIGNDVDTARALEKLGARHVECPVTERVVDRERKLVTSPAYMLATRISEVEAGVEKTIEELLSMA
jgi:enhancing lycopene biosynthesis protein 2